MCGRYTLVEVDGLQKRFSLEEALPEVSARYNVAPTQTMPVVTRHSPNQLELMRWGLIPSWAKEPNIGNRMINARAETVAEKPAFKRALERRRCLIPASGFYEWKQTESGKVPHYIHLTDEPLFAFAGLYENWKAPDETWVRSYTIITTTANDLMAPLHNRMPVILGREDEDLWLDPDATETERLLPLLRPYPARHMAAYPVSRAVNSPTNESPTLITPEAG
jgi:putative SOS response-associated peptidase YedK